ARQLRIEKFGDEEVRLFLEHTEFGNNKFVIRLLARTERGLTNHRPLTGWSEGRWRKSSADGSTKTPRGEEAMGATAALSAVVIQGMVIEPDTHRLRENRLYAYVGPCTTIFGGPSERTQTTAH